MDRRVYVVKLIPFAIMFVAMAALLAGGRAALASLLKDPQGQT
jgi:hypothetical protein